MEENKEIARSKFSTLV